MLNKEINKALAKENFSAEEMEEILSKLPFLPGRLAPLPGASLS